MAPSIRLQKLLADHGVASRRKAESLIASGAVRVNGAVVQAMGTRVDPGRDAVEVEGQVLKVAPLPLYILLHKPIGYLSTCTDPHGRATVLDLLPETLQSGQGLHPVGRLDYDSSGALLLSNDGEFTFQMTHPRHQLSKTYAVWVSGRPTATVLRQWAAGVLLEGRLTLPAGVCRQAEEANGTRLEITLTEGRNRQIRKVGDLLGHPVRRLHRTAIGPLVLGDLAVGAHRVLTSSEVQQLRESL